MREPLTVMGGSKRTSFLGLTPSGRGGTPPTAQALLAGEWWAETAWIAPGVGTQHLHAPASGPPGLPPSLAWGIP
jgi:hypothetical protein